MRGRNEIIYKRWNRKSYYVSFIPLFLSSHLCTCRNTDWCENIVRRRRGREKKRCGRGCLLASPPCVYVPLSFSILLYASSFLLFLRALLRRLAWWRTRYVRKRCASTQFKFYEVQIKKIKSLLRYTMIRNPIPTKKKENKENKGKVSALCIVCCTHLRTCVYSRVFACCVLLHAHMMQPTRHC